MILETVWNKKLDPIIDSPLWMNPEFNYDYEDCNTHGLYVSKTLK
jgi:hypothetical protein